MDLRLKEVISETKGPHSEGSRPLSRLLDETDRIRDPSWIWERREQARAEAFPSGPERPRPCCAQATCLASGISAMLSRRPYPGALFESISFPSKEMKSFGRHAGPITAFFHRSQGLLFFSPVLRRIWSKADFSVPLKEFKSLTECDVVVSEHGRLADFWSRIETGKETKTAGRFLLRPGRIQGASTFGLVFFHFPMGHLMVLVLGEAPKTVAKDLDTIVQLDPWDLTHKLSLWVRDSEFEYLVAHLLRTTPEIFRSEMVFLRSGIDLSSGPGTMLKGMTYRFHRDSWNREIISEIPFPSMDMGRSRHYGVLDGERISLNFNVFVGGILSLGVAAFPASFLEAGRLQEVLRFLHRISAELATLAKDLVSGTFDFCRHWTGMGFEMGSLEELSILVNPSKGLEAVLLPFWFDHQSLRKIVDRIDLIRYSTDLLFLDSDKGLGTLLLRNTDLEKAATIVAEKMRNFLEVPVGDPLTVEQFLENH